ncbi:MAG: hypothetical protein PHU36_02660 [Syntrophomonadaceae bacterium]|nr:hypothetical protein [Syntrophomonadaceae bacterium]
MKKKYWFLMVLVILVVAIAAPAAFGAITGGEQKAPEQQSQQPSDQMLAWHQQWLDQAQKEGQLTPEQAKTWQEHFNEMREFHSKNGLGPMSGMMNGMMNSMPEGSNGNHCSGGVTAEGDTTQI